VLHYAVNIPVYVGKQLEFYRIRKCAEVLGVARLRTRHFAVDKVSSACHVCEATAIVTSTLLHQSLQSHWSLHIPQCHHYGAQCSTAISCRHLHLCVARYNISCVVCLALSATSTATAAATAFVTTR
jgi:hypothetical protein